MIFSFTIFVSKSIIRIFTFVLIGVWVPIILNLIAALAKIMWNIIILHWGSTPILVCFNTKTLGLSVWRSNTHFSNESFWYSIRLFFINSQYSSKLNSYKNEQIFLLPWWEFLPLLFLHNQNRILENFEISESFWLKLIIN